MSARAGGSPAMLPKFLELWPRINKGLWLEIPDTPLKFYLCDGEQIRGYCNPHPIWQDFCLGGNSEAYPWMFPDAVILEHWMTPFGRRATAVHEFQELIAMAKGMAYERAHATRANPTELEYRTNPLQFRRIWDRLTAEYKEVLQTRHGRADRVGTILR